MSLSVIEMLVIFPPALFACWSVARLRAAERPVARGFLWKQLFLATIGFSISFGVGGFLSSYRIEHATRIHVRGVISNLENHVGKSSSTTFELITATQEHTPELTSLYVENHLQDGESVDVIYLTDFNEILSLTKTDAPHDWNFTRSDDLSGAHFCEGFGIFLALISLAIFVAWISSPTG